MLRSSIAFRRQLTTTSTTTAKLLPISSKIIWTACNRARHLRQSCLEGRESRSAPDLPSIKWLAGSQRTYINAAHTEKEEKVQLESKETEDSHASEIIIDVHNATIVTADGPARGSAEYINGYNEESESTSHSEAAEDFQLDTAAKRYNAAEGETTIDGLEYHLHDGEFTAEQQPDDTAMVDSTPWYLREADTHATVTDIAPLPDIPDDGPAEVTEILNYLATDLGLTELSLVDLRNRNTQFGPNAIMIVGTARSDRHLIRASEDLRVHLKKTYRAKSRIEGLVSNDNLKIQERRIKKKISKYTGDVSAYENDLRASAKNSWVFFDSRVKGIHIHVITSEKRWQLDLEGLWLHEMPQLDEQVTRHTSADLLRDRTKTKKKSKSEAKKYAQVGGKPKSFNDPLSRETPEFRLFSQEHHRLQQSNITNSTTRYSPAFVRRSFHTLSFRCNSISSHTDPVLVDSTSEVILPRKGWHESRNESEIIKRVEELTSAGLTSLAHLELEEILLDLCRAGQVSILRKIASLVPEGFTFQDTNDDMRSLQIAALTNFLILESHIETNLRNDLRSILTDFDEIISSDSGAPIHWRRRLEFLQVAHSLDYNEVPVRLLTDSLLEQFVHGVPIREEDFMLALTTIVLSKQFIPEEKQRAKIRDAIVWERVTDKRFAEICYLLRTCARPARLEIFNNPDLFTVLYRGCIQFSYDYNVLSRYPLPSGLGRWDKNADVIPVDPRAGMIDKIVIKHGIEATPTYMFMSLTSLAHAQRFDLFWKKWKDLFVYGVKRDVWMWSNVAVLVSRSGNVNAMEHFLAAQWPMMIAEFEADGFEGPVPEEMVDAVNICLQLVDPNGVMYRDIAELCKRPDDGAPQHERIEL
ncbi:hypothetical protein V1525DRAFT_380175 [Lipomyces kononenkoae]|uniref:Uncharacterized protein n=1 Tax=Lipomyces kononenkoae TaxID=34357 RepID=A0ACC3SXI4_LIPKO